MAKELVTWYDYESFAGMNISAQVGDIHYYTPTTSSAGYSVANQSDIIQIGRIKEIKLIDTLALDTGGDNGLTLASEARLDFQGDLLGCGNQGFDPCPDNPAIIRIDKSYKEAGIIPGMKIDVGRSGTPGNIGAGYTDTVYVQQGKFGTLGVNYVKAVNPNGDDDHEILIGQWNIANQADVYEDGERADIFQAQGDGIFAGDIPSGTVNQYGHHALGTATHRYRSKKSNWVYYEETWDEDLLTGPDNHSGSNWYFAPTRFKFSFDTQSISDNTVLQDLITNNTGGVVPVYPSTRQQYPSNATSGILSPFGNKTKFWMIVSEVEDIQVNKGNVPSVGDFQMFSKDNSVNLSSPLGYYARAKIENNSKVKSEMFGVSVDVFESSK